VKYFTYLGSIIANNARCTHENKSRIAIAEAAFNYKTLFTSKRDLILRTKIRETNNLISVLVLFQSKRALLKSQIYSRGVRACRRQFMMQL
jgi:hypothetical protein